MAANHPRLIWPDKETRTQPQPHVLVEDPLQSYPSSGNDRCQNRLICSDNLPALAALLPQFANQVQCVCIDPPYNTGQAMEHYDDGLEHGRWLGFMRDRLELLRQLLRPGGTLFCQLNDDEVGYARVLMDEIFGRENFINQISVKMKQSAGASGGGQDKKLKKNIEYLLVYARDLQQFARFNEVREEHDLFELIEDMRSSGKSWKYTRVVEDFGRQTFFRDIEDGFGNPIRIFRHDGFVLTPIGELMKRENIGEQECYRRYFDRIVRDTNAQSSIRSRVIQATADCGDMVSIRYTPQSGRSRGQQKTMYYKGAKRDLLAWLCDVAIRKGNRLVKLAPVGTYWDGFPLNNLTKEGGVRFPHGKKPEALVQRVLQLATQPGDLVLDAFLGSGTTAAVAHKMGRQWIGIEQGDHCQSHIIPRLRRVIDGQDSGGITRDVGWSGGGGFRYFKLQPTPGAKHDLSPDSVTAESHSS